MRKKEVTYLGFAVVAAAVTAVAVASEDLGLCLTMRQPNPSKMKQMLGK